MTLKSIYKLLFFCTMFIFFSCEEEDCTKMVLVQPETTDANGNVTPAKYQEVPCDFGEAVDSPVTKNLAP